jgi:plastocyanin
MRLTRAIKSRLRRFVAAGAVLTLGLVAALPVSADLGGGTTLRIGVGHVDPDNQQFSKATGNPIDGGRVWSYTDFFTRDVTIHRGDTLDFQTPPGEFHLIAVAQDGPTLRANLPLFAPDVDDPVAPGSGVYKVLLGPGAFALMSVPSCGLEQIGQPNCTFDGNPNAPVIAGGIGGAHLKKLLAAISGTKKVTPAAFNGTVDWNVTVNAAPGDYNYLCLIHPKMNGTVHVVTPGQATTSQGTINAQSLAQFAADRAEGQAKYAADNTPTFTLGRHGHRVFDGHVSDNTADGHVSFFEMMPRNLNLGVGDSVHWTWGPDSELHTVSFLTDSLNLPPPFMPDCGQFGGDDGGPVPTPFGPYCGDLPPTQAGFELMADPGNARPGDLSNTNPADPSSVVDSGVLVGADYGLTPSVQDWSAKASSSGTYAYQCTVHDWMRAVVQVTGA